MRKSFWILPISSLLSLSCATKSVELSTESKERNPAAPSAASVIIATPAVASAIVPDLAPSVDTGETAKGPQTESTPTTAYSVASDHASPRVEPEKALGWLKNGNTRYRKGFLRNDGQKLSDIRRLSKGQAPHSIILSCSDSRVPPEIIFDQKLGEIYVVRTAGEVPDQAAIASIEYAVEHLGARLLVVMGHTSCGAIKAALSTLGGGDAGSPALNALVHNIHPRLASFKGHKPGPHMTNESWANARGIVHELLAKSAILSDKTASGQLRIKAALYHLDDGKVAFDP